MNESYRIKNLYLIKKIQEFVNWEKNVLLEFVSFSM